MEVIVRQPHPRIGNSHGQETFSAPSADKQTRNLYIEYSNHQPSLSTLSPKGLFRSKMKWWAIHRNLKEEVISRLLHPRSGDRHRQEWFLAPSDDEQIRNYDIECSNHHPSVSTLSAYELSRSEMKWLTIYTNLPMDVIVRLPILGVVIAIARKCL